MFYLYFATAIILLLAGGLMVFIPLLPALPFMFLTAIGFGLLAGFSYLSPVHLGILAGIVVLSIITDTFSGAIGAKYGGASMKAIFWGIVGAIIGAFMFFPFGAIFGLFAGVVLAELWQHRDAKLALKSGGGAVAGAVTGIVINAILALIFFILFIVFVI